jgi:resuscitation-promoting factor RpfA
MAMSTDRDESPRDETLSRLYRQSADAEPPPALDAVILAAARREAVLPPAPIRPAPWWRYWLAPVGVFATIVLTVSLTLTIERGQREPPALPATTVAPRAKASNEALQREAPRTEPATNPAATTTLALPAAGPTVADSQREDIRTVAPPMAAQPAPAAGAMTGTPTMESSAALAVQAPAAAKSERLVRSPDDWIEEIRRLKKAEQTSRAREQLAAFRRAYPDYRLPEDLKPE